MCVCVQRLSSQACAAAHIGPDRAFFSPLFCLRRAQTACRFAVSVRSLFGVSLLSRFLLLLSSFPNIPSLLSHQRRYARWVAMGMVPFSKEFFSEIWNHLIAHGPPFGGGCKDLIFSGHLVRSLALFPRSLCLSLLSLSLPSLPVSPSLFSLSLSLTHSPLSLSSSALLFCALAHCLLFRPILSSASSCIPLFRQLLSLPLSLPCSRGPHL